MRLTLKGANPWWRRKESNLTMSRDPLPYLSRSRAHAIGPRHIYACRLSGCQASLTSALPPRSDPAGVPVSPGCRSALPFVRSLFFALLDHCRRWRSRDSNPGHSSSSQLSYCTISPVSPGCHVSTASRCPPASYGGQHSPPVFWPVNMAGTSCHGISLRRQISLAPGSGIPPAAGRSFPAVI